MTSPTCGLPNVDIFDPVQCTKRWNQCATQQQINVYLNGEILRTQECLQLFKQAQASVNEILDGKIKNHEERIAKLETASTSLESAKANLEKQFAELQAGNTKYQTDVDNTLKLYQSSINALTNTTNTLATEQQKMWAEINALKGSIDPAKINQALAGYEAIMTETKKLIEENNTALQVQFKQLETKFATLETDVINKVSESESAAAKRFSDFTRTVSGDIEAQNTRLNTFINSTNIALSKLQQEVANNASDNGKALESFTASLKELEEAYKKGDCALAQRIAAEEQARKDGDAALDGKLKVVEKDCKDSSEKLAKDLKEELSSFETNQDIKLLELQKNLRDSQDKAIDGLDEKLSSRVKALEITEEAHNKTTNKRIDNLSTEIGEGVDKRIADSAAAINTRITKVETEAKEENAALEAKLTKQIVDGNATASTDLSELKKLVDTQGELIQASRDESTLAWRQEVADRIEGDKNLQSQVDSLSKDVADAVTKGEEDIAKAIDAASTKLDERIKAVEETSEKLVDSDAKQWVTINNTVETMNQLRAQADKTQEIVEKFDDTAVIKLGERVDAVEKQIGELDVTELTKRVDALEPVVELHTAKLEQIEGRNLKADSDIAANTKRIDEAETKLDKEIADSAEGRSNLKKQIDTHTTVLAGQAEMLNEQYTKVKALEDASTNTNQSVAAIDARVKKLEDAGPAKGYDDTELRAQIQKLDEDLVSVGTNTDRNGTDINELQIAMKKLAVPPVTVFAVGGSGGKVQFLDKSGQAVRLEFDGNASITTVFSSLHHKCVALSGSVTSEATQNGKLKFAKNSMVKFMFFPLSADYKLYEGTVYIGSGAAYMTLTEVSY